MHADRQRLAVFLTRHRFAILFAALLAFFALMPLLHELGEVIDPRFPMIVVATVFLVTLLFVVQTTQRTPLGRRGSMLLGILTTVLWMLPHGGVGLSCLKHVLVIAFLVNGIVSVLTVIFSSRQVNSNILFASLCVYLLLGVVWAVGYSLMATLNPAAFASNVPGQPELGDLRMDKGHSAALYFSFVTLATLGYGDIIPTSPTTRMLATLEAIVGQLYLVVLVGRLVGLHIVATDGAGDGAGDRHEP